MPISPASPWWSPEIHAGRKPFLAARGRIKRALRQMFEAQGFTEVDPSCLQVSPSNEAHLHAFATERVGTDLSRHLLYLHTSPEFAMKKLLAAGETKIFTFAPVFRNREHGPLHHPEFTMLEWYRAQAPYEAVMADCEEILKVSADAAGATHFRHRGRSCDPRAIAQRLTMAEAFKVRATIDLLAHITPSSFNTEGLAKAARATGMTIPANYTFADILSRVLVEHIEPHLGQDTPTLLIEYPVSEAALARPKPSDPHVAERFELFVCGVELANGFGELTDATLQRRRFETEMDEKERLYGHRYPIDEDFLAALAHMPPASGCALGFERLVMLATGAQRIDQVVWTPTLGRVDI